MEMASITNVIFSAASHMLVVPKPQRPVFRGSITVLSLLVLMHGVTSSAQTRIHRHAGWMATSARELFNAAAFEASLYLSWLLSRRATRSLHAPLKQPAICTKQLASSITRSSRQGTCQPASIRHPGKDCHGTILSSQDRLGTGDAPSQPQPPQPRASSSQALR